MLSIPSTHPRQAELAKNDAERAKRLIATKAISDEDFDTKTRTYSSAIEQILLEAQDRLAASQTRTITALVGVYKALRVKLRRRETRRPNFSVALTATASRRTKSN